MLRKIKEIAKECVRRSSALTFLEMLVAIAVWVLVALAVSATFKNSLNVFRSSSAKAEAIQRAQISSEWLIRDIRSARGVVAANPQNISLVAEHNPEVISYYWLPSNQNMLRAICSSGAGDLLIEGASSFLLKYFDVNNQEIYDPVNNTTPIKNIEIDLTAVSNTKSFHLNSVAQFELNPEYPWARGFGDQSPAALTPL